MQCKTQGKETTIRRTRLQLYAHVLQDDGVLVGVQQSSDSFFVAACGVFRSTVNNIHHSWLASSGGYGEPMRVRFVLVSE